MKGKESKLINLKELNINDNIGLKSIKKPNNTLIISSKKNYTLNYYVKDLSGLNTTCTIKIYTEKFKLNCKLLDEIMNGYWLCNQSGCSINCLKGYQLLYGIPKFFKCNQNNRKWNGNFRKIWSLTACLSMHYI